MIQLPTDGGPVYAETDLSLFPVEPWNAISSLALILPAIYWAYRLRFDLKSYSFIYLCIVFLIIGGAGSTLYHAFRTSNLLLIMDVLPASLLTLLISIYFWFKILPNRLHAIFVIVPFMVFRFILFEFLPPEMAINLGYFISGSMFFVPILIFQRCRHFRYSKDITLSIGFLFASLLFREFDQNFTSYLIMGSHFLWHILSGIGAYYLGNFLYKVRTEELLADE